MKTTIIFVLVLALSYAAEEKTLVHEEMNNMLALANKANDAVDKVMQVLNDLLQSVDDERESLRTSHDNEEDYYSRTIGELTQIANTNCGIYDDAVSHREYVEAEIVDTTNYLDWIQGRYDTIDTLVQTLKDERCDASNVFVLRIMEHMEAQTAVEMLRMELQGMQMAGGVNFAEIDEMPSYNRLMAYTNMFKTNALAEFEQLAESSEDVNDAYMDDARRDAGDDHVDNTRGEQQLESFTTAGPTDVIGKMLVKLDELEGHLAQSMVDLRNNELRASYDTVKYIREAEKEVNYLQRQETQRSAYLSQMENDLVLAVDAEERTLQVCEDSKQTVLNTKAMLEAHRAFFMSELERLRGDEDVVEEVITIFQQELEGIDDVIRNQVGEYQVDESRFEQGMFRRVAAFTEVTTLGEETVETQE